MLPVGVAVAVLERNKHHHHDRLIPTITALNCIAQYPVPRDDEQWLHALDRLARQWTAAGKQLVVEEAPCMRLESGLNRHRRRPAKCPGSRAGAAHPADRPRTVRPASVLFPALASAWACRQRGREGRPGHGGRCTRPGVLSAQPTCRPNPTAARAAGPGHRGRRSPTGGRAGGGLSNSRLAYGPAAPGSACRAKSATGHRRLRHRLAGRAGARRPDVPHHLEPARAILQDFGDVLAHLPQRAAAGGGECNPRQADARCPAAAGPPTAACGRVAAPSPPAPWRWLRRAARSSANSPRSAPIITARAVGSSGNALSTCGVSPEASQTPPRRRKGLHRDLRLPAWRRSAPVQALQQHRQLRGRQRHQALARNRPQIKCPS